MCDFIEKLLPSLKDLSLIIGAIYAVRKIHIELPLSRKIREEDLRWKKAEAAKKLTDEMLNDLRAKIARNMLDYKHGRKFKLNESDPTKVTLEMVCKALDKNEENPGFADEDFIIRDSFDKLFYYMGIFQQHIQQGLIGFDDIKYPIDYYVRLIKQDPQNYDCFKRYIKKHNFYLTNVFWESNLWDAPIDFNLQE